MDAGLPHRISVVNVLWKVMSLVNAISGLKHCFETIASFKSCLWLDQTKF